ncbi:MAG TPA: autotransporter [Cellvibrionales bacterium]|jgi:hypothetical protein|nr:avidin/streptavidin family protein [Pseudomonadales bacterium]HCX26988.1 autotransporter [Cellvibrionales bacterium]
MKISKRFGCIKIILSSYALCFMNTVYAATPTCQNLKGQWFNELGSTLIISNIKGNGQLSGHFVSSDQAGGETFVVMGWVNDASPLEGLDHITAVTFAVNWDEYGSLSSWAGGCAIKDGIPTLSMIWNLVLANAQFEWDHMISNSDTFRPKK